MPHTQHEDKEDIRALIHCARHCSAGVRRLVWESKMDANLALPVAEGGWTPLCAAAQAGNPFSVMLLLEAGASVDKALPDGATPLAISADAGRLDVLKLLLNAKANANGGGGGGGGGSGDGTVYDVDSCEQSQQPSPLLKATTWGNADVVDALLQCGAAVDQPFHGYTPLMSACGLGYLPVVQLLLKAKANVYAQQAPAPAVTLPGIPDTLTEERSETPLSLAVQHSHSAVVAALLRAGANPDCRDGYWSHLHHAVRNGDSAIVRDLLAAGADVMYRDSKIDNMTALEKAQRGPRFPETQIIIDTLLQYEVEKKQQRLRPQHTMRAQPLQSPRIESSNWSPKRRRKASIDAYLLASKPKEALEAEFDAVW